MNPGALLVGLAAAVVLVSYIARPFRKLVDVDQEIEAWVAALRPDVAVRPQEVGFEPGTAEAAPRTAEAAPRTAEAAPRTAEDAPRIAANQPWVAEVPRAKPEPLREGGSDVAFCYQCGRAVKPHHRFCPRCGASLGEDDV
jgi:hypothetical protein